MLDEEVLVDEVPSYGIEFGNDEWTPEEVRALIHESEWTIAEWAAWMNEQRAMRAAELAGDAHDQDWLEDDGGGIVI